MQEPDDLKARWKEINSRIGEWWDEDLHTARESELRDPQQNTIWYADDAHREEEAGRVKDQEPTLLYLPFPYVASGGSEGSFPEMYAWDVYFINLGLAVHGRTDLIRHHILNHLFLIERYGKVLNGNRSYYLHRSQVPIHPESLRLLHRLKPDRDLIARAYPLLKQEYSAYWMAEHHRTPSGLATNRDLGELIGENEVSPSIALRPELAAEAEALDFTAIYDGDIRDCNPLITNCALVRYCDTLSWMAGILDWEDELLAWQEEKARRSNLIQDLCWDQSQGFFFEYNFRKETRLPYWSLSAYWAMWAGVASQAQAQDMVRNLERFEFACGLTQTDRAYPSPHPEYTALQWDYPHGWPPSQVIVIDALEAYGYEAEARRIARKFVKLQLDLLGTTGRLWEKYNVVDGNLDLPRERYPSVPMHGWSSAALAYLGNMLFGWE
jgi:alpha,alpha-trehalase